MQPAQTRLHSPLAARSQGKTTKWLPNQGSTLDPSVHVLGMDFAKFGLLFANLIAKMCNIMQIL